MLVTLMIISGCLIMGCCILIGFLIGKFIGQYRVEEKVIKQIESSPTPELIRFGQSLFKLKKWRIYEDS